MSKAKNTEEPLSILCSHWLRLSTTVEKDVHFFGSFERFSDI